MLNKQELVQAREWLKELTFADVEVDEMQEFINEQTDEQIERAIKRHWDGGIAGFKQTCL